MTSQHEHSEPERTGIDAFNGYYWELRKPDPRSSITGVSNGKSYGGFENDIEEIRSASYEVRAGIDWLKVYIYGTQSESDAVALSNWFNCLKEAAKQRSDERFFNLGDVSCEMAEHGVGKMSNSHQFFFRAGGVEISVAETFRSDEASEKQGRARDERQEKRRPVAMIEMKGQYCSGRSLDTLVQEIYWWCLQLSIADCEARVSRTDIAIDVVGRGVDEVFTSFLNGQIVTRARENQIHVSNRKVTGITFGAPGASTRLRVYDKVAELKKQPQKKANYESVFGPIGDQEITRYEWQLMRDGLRKNHDISDVEDFRDRIGALVEYLSSTWYRETDETEHQTNRRKEKAWSEIRDKTVEQFGGKFVERNRAEKIPAPVDDLVTQGVGCFTSAAALGRFEASSAVEVFAELWSHIVVAFDKSRERYSEKISQEIARRELAFEGSRSPRSVSEWLGGTIRKIVLERIGEYESPAIDTALRRSLDLA